MHLMCPHALLMPCRAACGAHLEFRSVPRIPSPQFSMENYRRVRQPRSEPVEADPSQVLVASLGNPVRLAREVKAKLEAADAKITVTAMGQAVGKAVAVGEWEWRVQGGAGL